MLENFRYYRANGNTPKISYFMTISIIFIFWNRNNNSNAKCRRNIFKLYEQIENLTKITQIIG